MEEIEETSTVVVDPPPFTIDPPPFPVSVPSMPATPADIEALMQYLVSQREQLAARIVAIESLLGFVATSDDLAVRVAKLELFLGIHP